MADPTRVELYEHYLEVWHETSPEKRASLLNATVTNALQYRDDFTTQTDAAGLSTHVAGFQERWPGCLFRLVAMLSWGQDALATWQFVDAAGEAGFSGYDALTFGIDGRITSIVGFSATDEQRLK